MNEKPVTLYMTDDEIKFFLRHAQSMREQHRTLSEREYVGQITGKDQRIKHVECYERWGRFIEALKKTSAAND
jgi:hypothetical protein